MTYPWQFSEKCPWHRKSTRDNSQNKNVTGTFECHGEKKTMYIYIIYSPYKAYMLLGDSIQWQMDFGKFHFPLHRTSIFSDYLLCETRNLAVIKHTRFIPLDVTRKKMRWDTTHTRKNPNFLSPLLNFIDGTHTHFPDPMFDMGHMRWDTHTLSGSAFCVILVMLYTDDITVN